MAGFLTQKSWQKLYLSGGGWENWIKGKEGRAFRWDDVAGKKPCLLPLFNINELKFGGIFDPKIMTNLYPLLSGNNAIIFGGVFAPKKQKLWQKLYLSGGGWESWMKENKINVFYGSV